MIMHALMFIAILACFLGRVTTIGAPTCYFPDGSEANRDTTCRAQAYGQASACCAYMDICLDNSLCLSAVTEVITRGSCTDPTWQSPNCPRYCQDGKLQRQNAKSQRSLVFSHSFVLSSVDIIISTRLSNAHTFVS